MHCMESRWRSPAELHEVRKSPLNPLPPPLVPLKALRGRRHSFPILNSMQPIAFLEKHQPQSQLSAGRVPPLLLVRMRAAARRAVPLARARGTGRDSGRCRGEPGALLDGRRRQGQEESELNKCAVHPARPVLWMLGRGCPVNGTGWGWCRWSSAKSGPSPREAFPQLTVSECGLVVIEGLRGCLRDKTA